MATSRARRLPGEGSLYQRSSDGRWVGVVDLGWAGGKRLRKPVYGKTKREAAAKMSALKRSVEQGVIPDDATVEQWLTHWIDDIAPSRVRARTLSEYRGYLRRYVIPSVGKVRLDRLKPEHVRAMLRGMEEDELSPATRRQAYAVLRRALEVAVREQRVTRNVAALIDPPKVEKNPHGSLSRAETRALMDLLAAYGDDGRWDIASRYLVAILAGLRQGEALGLRWEDVDLERGVLHVRRSVQRLPGRGIVVEGVKSARSERTVPLMPPVAFALTRWRDGAPAGYVWGGASPTDPRRDWGAWKGLLGDAGCDNHPLHSARSTTANILHDAGVPDRRIADILGHANFAVTWDHYLSSEDRQLVEAVTAAWKMLEAT